MVKKYSINELNINITEKGCIKSPKLKQYPLFFKVNIYILIVSTIVRNIDAIKKEKNNIPTYLILTKS